jgi:hypothetical protein
MSFDGTLDDVDRAADEAESDASVETPMPASGKKPRKPPPKNIRDLTAALRYAEPRPALAAKGGKGPYGARLSRALAQMVADGLRKDFKGILPSKDGKGHESRARTAKGFKQLDVNYSTAELGLGLGVSLKTINYMDQTSKRFTKNYTRADNELRAEAIDYHQRQPYAVLVGILFLPLEACDDATVGKNDEAGVSSFGAAIRHFRHRAGRVSPDDPIDQFEGFFVATYGWQEPHVGLLRFYDVERHRVPKNRRPHEDETLDFSGTLARIREIYDARNIPSFEWAEN